MFTHFRRDKTPMHCPKQFVLNWLIIDISAFYISFKVTVIICHHIHGDVINLFYNYEIIIPFNFSAFYSSTKEQALQKYFSCWGIFKYELIYLHLSLQIRYLNNYYLYFIKNVSFIFSHTLNIPKFIYNFKNYIF